MSQEMLEVIESFWYFGSVVSRTEWADEDVKARIGKVRQAFFETSLENLLSVTEEKAEDFLFESQGSPTLQGETCSIAKGLLNKLQVFVNKCVRTTLGITWPERTTNEDLWRLSDQKPVELELKLSGWREVGHTLKSSGEECNQSP